MFPGPTASGPHCGHTMLQHDSWGAPLFVHYNLLKQIPSGIGRGFSWGQTKQLPLFNLFPATPATARLGEPEQPPRDEDRPGLGDVDCDMLADADEYGVARRPAKEMIMRRAARERGVKAKYHGGWISALWQVATGYTERVWLTAVSISITLILGRKSGKMQMSVTVKSERSRRMPGRRRGRQRLTAQNRRVCPSRRSQRIRSSRRCDPTGDKAQWR